MKVVDDGAEPGEQDARACRWPAAEEFWSCSRLICVWRRAADAGSAAASRRRRHSRRVWRYTQTMRWNAVKLVRTAMTSKTPVSTSPSQEPPKSMEATPMSTTRSGRCMRPTLQSSPSASARARV